MSSSLVRSPAPRRPVAFAPAEACALLLKHFSAIPKLAGVTPASRLEVRPTPEMVSSGVREIDALTGGLPRGCLTEVCGPASSGRTSVLLAALAAAAQRQEACALVDTTDAFDPPSAAAAGVDFERLLWVRCGVSKRHLPSPRRHPSTALRAGSDTEKKEDREFPKMESPVEQALRVTDLLLQSDGFGLVAIDLGDVPLHAAQRIPLTSWFRFQRAVENTPTVLFVVAQAPCARTCAALLLRLRSSVAGRQSSGKKLSALSHQLSVKVDFGSVPNSIAEGHAFNCAELIHKKSAFDSAVLAHAQLLDGFHIQAELLRARMECKPMQSVSAAFVTRAVRAG
jgi:recombination protein RecA